MKIWNTRPLQKFGFSDSAYERSSQKWICGHARNGKACQQGPGADGRCTTRAECMPRKDNDRWLCNRAQSEGGACADGPLSDGSCCRSIIPCSPQRGIRSARGALTKWVAVLAFGILTVILTAPYGAKLLSPGPLNTHHAELTKCATCHDGSHGSLIEWAGRIFVPPAAKSGSAGCINCHTMGAAPLQAHSTNRPEPLTVNKAEMAANPLFLNASKKFMGGPFAGDEEISCATCHQEHGGPDADIKEMSNGQCQACHTLMFKGFLNGHPKFTEYPYTRRTRITFNHEGHFKRHFPESKQPVTPTECQDCHVSGDQGRVMMVKPFEKTCATCHLGEVTGRVGSGPRTIAFLSLPGFDLEALQDADINIGAWPEFAEQPLDPFMKLMLAADGKLKDDIARLEDIDLLDLEDAEPEVLKSIEQVAWGVKELMYDLTAHGPMMIIKSVTMSTQMSDAEASDLISALPFDVVRSTSQKWFPNLIDELERRKAGEVLPTVIASEEEADGLGPIYTAAGADTEASPEQAVVKTDFKADLKSWMQFGGWQDRDFDLLYRPTKHGDRFMKVWISTTATASSGPLGDLARPLFDFLTDKKSAGKCAKCHSVDEAPDKTLTVNWTARLPTGKFRDMTVFSHDKHNAILQKNGCKSCHNIAENAPYLDSFKDMNATTFTSNFTPLNKEVCTECHTDQSTLGACTTCHNYHFGEVSLVETMSSIKPK